MLLEHLLNHGKGEAAGQLAQITLQNANTFSPKLAAVANSVKSINLKTLILVYQDAGAQTLVHLLTLHDVKPVFLSAVPDKSTDKERERIRTDNDRNLRAFNSPDNVHGRVHRVIVAAAEEFGEGSSFMQVRRIIILGLTPPDGRTAPSWASMKQRFGRALRCCSHDALPPHMRTLRTDLYVSVHQQSHKYPPTLETEQLLLLLRDIPLVEQGMDFLANLSMDAPYYRTSGDASPTSGLQRVLQRFRSKP